MDFSILKDIREDHDITQEKIAGILGVNRSRYSLWELGINIIPIKYLTDFADYFDLNIDYIAGFSKKRKLNNIKDGFDKMILGSNLREIRRNAGLSQAEFAKVINVSQAAVNKYEKGLITISFSNLYAIAKKYNVSINYLLGKLK